VSILILRYLDVCLVLATAPFAIAGAMPLLGYVIGALAWLLTRLGAAAMYAQALRSRDVRTRAGLQVGTMMMRVWIIVAAVILARYAGSRNDGITAATVVLAAFTVYFVLNLVTRGGQLQGKPSPS
jgi:ABC-type xylose transport system permease subunit